MGKNNNVEENDIVLYGTKDITKIFNCSRQQAYTLMNSAGFPAIRINSKYLVEKGALEKWLEKNAGRKIKA